MARPTKHPDEKRSQRFNLRFTVAELEHVETQAAIAGLEPHDYLRRRALGYEVPSAATRRADPGLVTELNKLGLELAAIGNNANQLARDVNSGRAPKVAWEAVVERIDELGEKTTTALEKVVLLDP